VTDFAIIIAPNTILVCLYLFVDGFKERPIYFVVAWFVVLFLCFATGLLLWEQTQEISFIGSGIIVSSSVWLSGLLMALTAKTRRFGLYVIPLTIGASLLSFFGCFFMLILMGQIWGL